MWMKHVSEVTVTVCKPCLVGEWTVKSLAYEADVTIEDSRGIDRTPCISRKSEGVVIQSAEKTAMRSIWNEFISLLVNIPVNYSAIGKQQI
jgi:hypothetical protein